MVFCSRLSVSGNVVNIYNESGIIIGDNARAILRPKGFQLYQNYPNPFNSSTRIIYDIPKSIDVRIKIYNVIGQEISTLVNEEKMSGRYNIFWNAEGVPSGVYFYRIVAGEFTQAKEMVVVK